MYASIMQRKQINYLSYLFSGIRNKEGQFG